MYRARLEVGLKLKKTLREIDAMPHFELMSWIALLEVKAKEHKKAMESRRR
jgi:hypothetical protein